MCAESQRTRVIRVFRECGLEGKESMLHPIWGNTAFRLVIHPTYDMYVQEC